MEVDLRTVLSLAPLRTAAIFALGSGLFAPIANANAAPPVGEKRERPIPLRLPVEGMFPSLQGATGWLNSEPLTAEGLRGKVVLVEFGTYSCINWIRTLPHVRAWAEKYRDQGLIVLVVHTPEFGFETDVENISRAMQDLRVDFPTAIDSDYAIWRAFQNNFWPALYFIDANGRIRYHRFGEDEYEKSETVIQQLLTEAGNGEVDRRLVSPEATGVEAAPDWNNLRTRETYLGSARSENLASPGGVFSRKSRGYTAPSRLKLNQWALAGDWKVASEFAVLNKPNGRIVIRFHARDLHLVMGPITKGSVARFRVLIDGQVPAKAHGVDVDEHGNGRVDRHRMYQLVRQRRSIEERLFEIEFLDAGVEVFSFTFG